MLKLLNHSVYIVNLLCHHPDLLHLGVCFQEGPVTFIADLAKRRPVRLRRSEPVEFEVRSWFQEREVRAGGNEAKMAKDVDT